MSVKSKFSVCHLIERQLQNWTDFQSDISYIKNVVESQDERARFHLICVGTLKM